MTEVTTSMMTEIISDALKAINVLLVHASGEIRSKIYPLLKAFVAESNGMTPMKRGNVHTISGTEITGFDKSNLDGTDYSVQLTEITDEEIRSLVEKMGDAQVQERFGAFLKGLIAGLSA